MHLTLDDLGTGPRVIAARPIRAEDLAALRTRAPVPPRQKLRYKHHALARSLASGLGEAQAAMVCGFAPVTVSILKRDPAFAELVRFYETENGKGFDAARAQILGVGQKLVEEIERRVTEQPEEISMRDLRDTAETLLDRGGLAPQTHATHDINIHAGLADALKAARMHAPYPALPAPSGFAAAGVLNREAVAGAATYPAPEGRSGTVPDPTSSREAAAPVGGLQHSDEPAQVSYRRLTIDAIEIPGSPHPSPPGPASPPPPSRFEEGGGGSMFVWDD